jgi:hypothetical protein
MHLTLGYKIAFFSASFRFCRCNEVGVTPAFAARLAVNEYSVHTRDVMSRLPQLRYSKGREETASKLLGNKAQQQHQPSITVAKGEAAPMNRFIRALLTPANLLKHAISFYQ